jgi:hypothetical protein
MPQDGVLEVGLGGLTFRKLISVITIQQLLTKKHSESRIGHCIGP